MRLITLRNLGMTSAEPLFSHLNFTVSKGDRIGLVAANGTGKSTLLHCLAGTLARWSQLPVKSRHPATVASQPSRNMHLSTV